MRSGSSKRVPIHRWTAATSRSAGFVEVHCLARARVIMLLLSNALSYHPPPCWCGDGCLHSQGSSTERWTCCHPFPSALCAFVQARPQLGNCLTWGLGKKGKCYLVLWETKKHQSDSPILEQEHRGCGNAILEKLEHPEVQSQATWFNLEGGSALSMVWMRS